MTEKLARIITEVCNDLPFVNWDRYIDCGVSVVVFGWIDRESDRYKDFVSIEVSRRGYLEFTTSSAKYSQVISEIFIERGRLAPGTHVPCQRIEDKEELSDIRNVIRIRERGRQEG